MSESHPLIDVGMTVNNFKSFGDDGGGFLVFSPVNIVIGRNNTGKSALIDAIELCISGGATYDKAKYGRSNADMSITIIQLLDEITLRNTFPERTTGGGVPGDHWQYGKKFIGQVLKRNYGPDWKPSFLSGPNFDDIIEQDRTKYINSINVGATQPFGNLHLRKISAERDIQPEASSQTRSVNPNGEGATNIVRAFISSDNLPREEVEVGLLEDLNTVYRGDSDFSHIICQENENTSIWELFLHEKTKGDIRLSESGSSLKSIFIVLCMLRLVPIIDKIKWQRVVFAFEEPENNLHPALLRRLLDFLSDQRKQKGFTLIITTHSPICIDWSAKQADSQIIHIQHDGRAATSRTAIEYRHNREIIEDLDIRASDILQANGVIWVEGPSDRIYIRRWIDLASERRLKEGVHYTIMFYGGKLLSHLDALPPEESEGLISLLSINRNAAVIIDSDRHSGTPGRRKPRMNLNTTKLRVKKELEKIGGYVWITEGREIENYTPVEVFARISRKRAPKVDSYTQIAKLPFLKTFKGDKIAIAHAVVPETQKVDLEGHLDIWQRLNELCSHIERWNGLQTSK